MLEHPELHPRPGPAPLMSAPAHRLASLINLSSEILRGTALKFQTCCYHLHSHSLTRTSASNSGSDSTVSSALEELTTPILFSRLNEEHRSVNLN